MEYLGFLISENASFFQTYGNWVLIPTFVLLLVVDHFLQKSKLSRLKRFAIRMPVICGVFFLGALIYTTNFAMKPMVDSLSVVQNNIGQKVYDFEFINMKSGKIHRISNFEGRPVILNFWATYCGPCIEEFPDLQAIENEYAQEVWVIAISDEDKERISRFVQRVKSPAIVGSFSLEDAWIDLESFRPVTVFIDRDGIVREYTFGKKDYDYFKAAIEKFM